MNSDGSQAFQLTKGMTGIGGKSSWSPDGRLIAFFAGASLKRQIYIMDANGGNLHSITRQGNNLAPSFSPDGQWIAFTSYDYPDVKDHPMIYIIRINGNNREPLTGNTLFDWEPYWGK